MTTIQPRSAWAAGPNGRVDRGALAVTALTGLTLHWPGGGTNLTGLRGAQVAAQLRTWQAQHRRQGWADIGYNFLIDGGGTIWEGCGWYRGAHAGSGTGNRTTVGLQLITGTNEGPTQAQIEAVRGFRQHQLLARNPRATWVGPHSHWTGTECPGNRIRSLIASGAFSGAPAGGGPALTTPTTHEGDDMSYPVEIRYSGTKGHRYVVSHGVLTHIDSGRSEMVKNVLTTDDRWHVLGLEDGKAFLASMGIPLTAVDLTKGHVRDMMSGKLGRGLTYSRFEEAAMRGGK